MTLEATQFKTPGQLLQALLEQKGWSQVGLALVLGIDKATLNRLVGDKRPMSTDMALALSELFDVPAERFLDLQQSYDLAKARLTARPDPARATRAHLFGGLPIAEMMKRGWLDGADVRDVAKLEGALARFFGVERPSEIEILPHAAKKTQVTTAATSVQIAWINRVKQIAKEMLVSKYSDEALRATLDKLKSLLTAPEEARKVPRLMAECGVRFVIVESLTSAKIDGVCLWLNERSPVIGMSLRHDRIDNFWFVLRHEIEHVLCRHGLGAAVLDAELEGDRAGTSDEVSEEERVANAAAADFCVPKSKMDGFVARKSPFFAERDILGFARTINVHPGLIAGQLQHLTRRYDRFRNHLVKIRSAVAPSAIVDGWGDVAPVDP
jgi:HTH-type transcriptional regulator/antitoxin HigA